MVRQQTFTAVFQRSGEWWAAWIEGLPGANTQGATLEEAHENLIDAAQMILDGAKHSKYRNPANNKQSVVPRHNEVNDITAENICKDLGIPKP